MRKQDAFDRRIPCKKKIGVGRVMQNFLTAERTGDNEHIGFQQSPRMLGCQLIWRVKEMVEEIKSVFEPSSTLLQWSCPDCIYVLGAHQVPSGGAQLSAEIADSFRFSAEKQHRDIV